MSLLTWCFLKLQRATDGVSFGALGFFAPFLWSTIRKLEQWSTHRDKRGSRVRPWKLTAANSLWPDEDINLTPPPPPLPKTYLLGGTQLLSFKSWTKDVDLQTECQSPPTCRSGSIFDLEKVICVSLNPADCGLDQFLYMLWRTFRI